jgi:hypothetical protein
MKTFKNQGLRPLRSKTAKTYLGFMKRLREWRVDDMVKDILSIGGKSKAETRRAANARVVLNVEEESVR